MIQRPEPYYFQFKSKQIDFHTTARLFLDLEKIKRANAIVLDFNKAECITPYGMIILYAIIRRVIQLQPAARVSILFSKGIIGYLTRMHLVDSLNVLTNVDVISAVQRMHEHDRSDWLREFEIIPIHSHDESDDLAESLFELIATNVNPDQELQNALNTGLSELLDNIISHSGTQMALVAVQSYRDKLLLAIGDMGVGIPDKLRTLGPTDLSDAELIQKSLEAKVTTRVGGGGTGLTDTLDAIQSINERGALLIRSNGGFVWASKPESTRGKVGTLVPGTYISLYLKR